MRASRLETEITAYTKASFGGNSASLLAFTDELLLRETDKTNIEGRTNIERRISLRCADPAYVEERQLVIALWRQCKKTEVFRKVYNAAVDAMPLEYPSSDGLFLT